MASLEQKTALVDKYCNVHREWVQNAEMHQRNYDFAMSDYASANQRANSAQYELERLYDQMSCAETEMRYVESELNLLNDGQEHSASEYQYLRNRLERARDSYMEAQRQVGSVQGQLQQAQGEARQAYLVAQQESQQYEQAQANVDKCAQVLEQMSAQLSQEADVLQMQVNSESSYASTLQGASGNMFANSALAAAGRLQASASTKQAELTGTQALIDRIHQELNGGDSTASMGAKVLRRR